MDCEDTNGKITLPNGGIGIVGGLKAALGIVSAESLTVRILY